MARRSTSAFLGLIAMACISADESTAPLLADAAALVLVRVRPHRPTAVRVIEPVDPRETTVLAAASGDLHTYVMVYDRPLSAYGLRVDGGELVQRAGGVPLPPPTRWLEATAGRGLEERSGLNTAQALPDVRVPSVACPTLEEERDTRYRPHDGRTVTFVGPAGRGRYLLGLAHDTEAVPTSPATLALVTAPSGLPQVLDIPLTSHDVRGFVARDGSSWVAAQTTTPTATSPNPVLCHFRVGGPYDASACRLARGASGRYPLERLSGWYDADGRVVLVGMSWDFQLAAWVGTEDAEGEWSAWLAAGKSEQADCNVGAASVSLWVDGPGIGVAAPESGPLLAFDLLSPGGATSTPLYEPTSCRGAFVRTTHGAELFARVPQVATENFLLATPTVLWRGNAETQWSELAPNSLLEASGGVAIGDVVLVPSKAYSVTPLIFDHLRPDLPPRVCDAVSVYNTASAMADLGDGRVLIGGTPPNMRLLPGAISTWRVVGQ